MLTRERGASAVIVAGSLLLLFGIAALAVDYGAVLSERSQDVAAADTAVTSGLVAGAVSGNISAIQEAVDTAKAVAEQNNGAPITNADWAACTDDDPLPIPSDLAVLAIAGNSPCISFNELFTEMRVVLPEQETATSFGRIVGVTSIGSSAAAEARLVVGTFPAGTYSGATPGDLVCIATVAHGSPASAANCNGDLDYLQPFAPVPYTGAPACNTGFLPIFMRTDISHSFGASSGGGSRLNGCVGGVGVPFPDQVTETAISAAQLTQGMLGVGGGPGRLTLAPTDGAMTIGGIAINNIPLWTFIDTSLALSSDCASIGSLPAHPTAAQFASIGITSITPWQDAEAMLISCITNHTGVLFRDTLMEAPRFAVAPQFNAGAPSGGVSAIRSFSPIYLHAEFVELPPAACSTAIFDGGTFCRHQAGVRGTITPGTVSSVAALVLRCEHLPDQACSRATDGWNRTYVLDIELTR